MPLRHFLTISKEFNIMYKFSKTNLAHLISLEIKTKLLALKRSILISPPVSLYGVALIIEMTERNKKEYDKAYRRVLINSKKFIMVSKYPVKYLTKHPKILYDEHSITVANRKLS